MKKSLPRATVRMRFKFLVTGCLLLGWAAIAAAAPTDAGAGARQAPSCGEWIVHREKSDTLALGNASWLLGYLSGMVTGSGRNFLSGMDNASIYRWMDAYCRKNPLRDVASGAHALAAESSGTKAAPK
jgi:hypothetical protein